MNKPDLVFVFETSPGKRAEFYVYKRSTHLQCVALYDTYEQATSPMCQDWFTGIINSLWVFQRLILVSWRMRSHPHKSGGELSFVPATHFLPNAGESKNNTK